MEEPRQLTSIVGHLLDGGVDFVLVGALAAVAQGVPLTTHDVDIVHARTSDNLDRLMAVLTKLNARYRGRAADSPLTPDRKALATPGHSLLMTDLGPLDRLGAIEGDRDFDVVVPLAVVIDLDGRPLRVLGLETILMLKRQSVALKDRMAVPLLEAALKRRDQR
jgi:predicted nucleotidyltransferase